MTFSERLRGLRDAAGLTQEELAIKAGMSVGNVRNYEQGIRLPAFPAVVKLAAALGAACTVFAECSDVVGDLLAEQPKGEKPAARKGKGGKK